jgi:hypothetical protein
MAKNINAESTKFCAKRIIKVEVAEKSHCIRFNGFIVQIQLFYEKCESGDQNQGR